MDYTEWVFHDIEPIYSQLVKKLRYSIYSRQISVGDKIPSIREMAKMLHINSNTVSRAYKIVCNDGLIASSRGIHYSVTIDENHIMQKRENVAKELCCLYFSNMLELGFSKKEAIAFIQDYSDRLKI